MVCLLVLAYLCVICFLLFSLGVCYVRLVVFGGGKLRCWWFSGLSYAGCFGYPVFLFSGCGCVTLVIPWCGVVW